MLSKKLVLFGRNLTFINLKNCGLAPHDINVKVAPPDGILAKLIVDACTP